MLIKDATKVTKDLLSHLQDPEFNDIKIRGGGAVQQDYPPYESKGSTPFAQYYDQKEYSFYPERSCQTDKNKYLLLLLLKESLYMPRPLTLMVTRFPSLSLASLTHSASLISGLMLTRLR